MYVKTHTTQSMSTDDTDKRAANADAEGDDDAPLDDDLSNDSSLDDDSEEDEEEEAMGANELTVIEDEEEAEEVADSVPDIFI